MTSVDPTPGMGARLEQIAKFVDDFLAPWGSWKTAWWEGEVSDNAAFSENNALKHIANLARRPLRSAETSAAVGGVERDCERCQGNGEIITDWGIYMHPPEDAPADAGTADCPDCFGSGKAEDPTPRPAPVELEQRAREIASRTYGESSPYWLAKYAGAMEAFTAALSTVPASNAASDAVERDDALLTVAAEIDAELFCGDEVREHKAASPLKVSIAQGRVLAKAHNILAALNRRTDAGGAK